MSDPGEPEVIITTDDDIDVAVAREVAECGFSVRELRAMAEAEDFATDRAERAWYVIRMMRRCDVPMASCRCQDEAS